MVQNILISEIYDIDDKQFSSQWSLKKLDNLLVAKKFKVVIYLYIYVKCKQTNVI